MNQLFIFFIAFTFIACTASDQSNAGREVLSFDELVLSKNQTAIIGKVEEYRTENSNLFAVVEVLSMKQGGASAPAFTPGMDLEVVFTSAFQRVYLEKNKTSLHDELQTDMEALLTISRNLKTGRNHVSFFKSKNQ